jgi:hypothetical protein
MSLDNLWSLADLTRMAEIRVMRMGHARHVEELRNMHVGRA